MDHEAEAFYGVADCLCLAAGDWINHGDGIPVYRTTEDEDM